MDLSALECFRSDGTWLKGNLRTRSSRDLLDDMPLRQKELWGFASDDSHAPEFGHTGIDFKAKECSIPAVIPWAQSGRIMRSYEAEYRLVDGRRRF